LRRGYKRLPLGDSQFQRNAGMHKYIDAGSLTVSSADAAF